MKPANLAFAHRHVVDVAGFDGVFGLQLVLVDANDHVLAAVDAGLLFRRCRFNLELGPATVDGLGHAAHGVDFLDDGPGGVGHVLGQLFHHVAAGPGVDHVGDVGFFLDDELGVARNAGAELGGQRNGFVKAVGVQALRAAEHGSHGLDGGTHHVVVRVLLGQAPATGLAVGAQHQALRALGVKALHDATPQQASRAHLGDFQVEVHANRPEKTQAPGKFVHIHALGDGGLDIFLAISQRECQFQRLVGAGFLHVVAADTDRVELRHVLGRVLDDVANDAHAGRRRVDIGIADHELFQNVVLNGSAEFVLAHALLFRRHHITGQHRQHGAVHGHGHADLVQRDLVEQDFHVLDRIDGHAGLADVTRHARMVAVIAPVGGQVERHADTLTTGGQRLAVEGIRFLGRGKAGILANRPRPHRVHRGLGAAQIGLKTGQRVGIGQIGGIGCGVQRLDRDAVRRVPVQGSNIATGSGFGGGFVPSLKAGCIEFGQFCRHGKGPG